MFRYFKQMVWLSCTKLFLFSNQNHEPRIIVFMLNEVICRDLHHMLDVFRRIIDVERNRLSVYILHLQRFILH